MNTDTLISLYYPFLLSISFSLVLPAMINLFKKNIHSLFTFTTVAAATTTTTTSISELGLITTTNGVDSAPNVLESGKLKPDPPPDWIDDTGLVSCTESLGFESSDEIHNKNVGDGDGDGGDEIWRRTMMRAEGRGNRRKLRSFPPPLSSLNRNGKPSFFLRPVRKDGRLELTEVRIHRAEILHASRHDGRLTLHLIPDQVSLEEEEEEEIEEEEDDQDEIEEDQEQEEEELVEEEEELEEEVALDDDEKEEEEEEIECEREERVAEWGFHEGYRRCHEMVNQHHHHHHNVHGNHHHNHIRMCGISIV